MVEQKYKLPNGNTFIWLGNQAIRGCNNAVVLSGGNVLLLKTEIEYTADQIKRDITTLSKDDFLSRYGWEKNSSSDDLYWELKQ